MRSTTAPRRPRRRSREPRRCCWRPAGRRGTRGRGPRTSATICCCRRGRLSLSKTSARAAVRSTSLQRWRGFPERGPGTQRVGVAAWGRGEDRQCRRDGGEGGVYHAPVRRFELFFFFLVFSLAPLARRSRGGGRRGGRRRRGGGMASPRRPRPREGGCPRPLTLPRTRLRCASAAAGGSGNGALPVAVGRGGATSVAAVAAVSVPTAAKKASAPAPAPSLPLPPPSSSSPPPPRLLLRGSRVSSFPEIVPGDRSTLARGGQRGDGGSDAGAKTARPSPLLRSQKTSRRPSSSPKTAPLASYSSSTSALPSLFPPLLLG